MAMTWIISSGEWFSARRWPAGLLYSTSLGRSSNAICSGVRAMAIVYHEGLENYLIQRLAPFTQPALAFPVGLLAGLGCADVPAGGGGGGALLTRSSPRADAAARA